GGVEVEMGMRRRDRERMPSRHHGDEGAEGEAAVGHVARLERLMHGRRGVDLARNPMMAFHVENERIEGALPTDEVERMMAEGDPRHLPAGVLHVDRKLAALIAVRRESRGLDL